MRTRAKTTDYSVRLVWCLLLSPPRPMQSTDTPCLKKKQQQKKTRSAHLPPLDGETTVGFFAQGYGGICICSLFFFPSPSISPSCDLTDATRLGLVPIKLERDGNGR